MADEQDDFDDEASLRQVEQGGIPLLAQRRLRQLSEGAGAFTSDLSVADFALCRQLGLTPLSQVMGTSIYQVGYQTTGYQTTALGYGRSNWGGVGMGAAGERGELRVISHAWNEVRERAFARLAEEAATVGADAVVGVEVRSGVANWTEVGGNGAIEYVVTGTAVRRERGPTDAGGSGHGHPGRRHTAGGRGKASSGTAGLVLTELSVADYAKLLSAGVEPAGIVAWTAVFFVSLIYFQAERESLGIGLGGGLLGAGSYRNFEYKGATQTFYDARERVMGRLGEQAQRLGASGIVGVRIGHTIRSTEGGGPRGAGLIASFSALGTAVHVADAKPQAPTPTIDLTT